MRESMSETPKRRGPVAPRVPREIYVSIKDQLRTIDRRMTERDVAAASHDISDRIRDLHLTINAITVAHVRFTEDPGHEYFETHANGRTVYVRVRLKTMGKKKPGQ